MAEQVKASTVARLRAYANPNEFAVTSLIPTLLREAADVIEAANREVSAYKQAIAELQSPHGSTVEEREVGQWMQTRVAQLLVASKR